MMEINTEAKLKSIIYPHASHLQGAGVFSLSSNYLTFSPEWRSLAIRAWGMEGCEKRCVGETKIVQPLTGAKNYVCHYTLTQIQSVYLKSYYF